MPSNFTLFPSYIVITIDISFYAASYFLWREEKMSAFSFPPITTNSSKKTKYWYTVVMSELFIFCSFILSHPLYFSYLIFFSPYIIKICSFLSPLFITTSLLLLVLLTTINVNENNSEKYSKLSFLLSKLGSDIAEEESKDYFQRFEEFEAYKIVFKTSQLQGWTETENESDINSFSIAEPPPESVDKHLCHEISSCTFSATGSQVFNEISLAEIKRAESKSIHLIAGDVRRLRGFLEEEDDEDDFVDVSCGKGTEKEVKTQIQSVEFNKVEEEEQKAATEAEISIKSSESKETAAIFGSKIINSEEGKMENGSTDSFSDGEFRWKKNIKNNSENSMGSMRKEKEWRRTLACKLFEERHNSNIEATEGMDLLWEIYEESTTDRHSNKKQQLTKSKTKKFSSKYHNDDDYKDDEEEEMGDGQLCCLQALKFSAGKMNLGMGRPNLMKISKTFKGIGWLHNLTKHGKKMYH